MTGHGKNEEGEMEGRTPLRPDVDAAMTEHGPPLSNMIKVLVIWITRSSRVMTNIRKFNF